MSEVIHYLGVVLLFAGPLLASRAAIRFRDMRRLDVAAFLVALALSSFPLVPQGTLLGQSLRTGFIALQPYFALRLVNHFRPVSRFMLVGGLTVPAVLAGWQLSDGDVSALTSVRSAYVALGLIPSAVALAAESRRSSGIKAKRLLLAAIGTSALALVALSLATAAVTSDEFRFAIAWTLRQLQGAGIICYFFAFTPPQRLIARWRKAEQADYLNRTVDREPEERGWLAAQDLVAGVARTVGGALAFAARRADRASDLVVVASSDDRLTGWRLSGEDPSIGRALDTVTPVLGRTAACGPALSERLAPYGELVLVAPIVTSGEDSGVVVAVHRRGALFPEDDLASLAQMARSAGVALDHAALVRERRVAAQEVANRRLRELESRVGVMVDSIRDYAMLVVDATGTVAAWHLGAEGLFGHSRDTIARRSAASLFGLTEADLNGWLSEAQATGVAEREGDCHRADGSRFVGITTIRPLVPEPGMPAGFVIVTHDVSEQRRLEERVRQGQKMEAIGTLASGVAHDFNNVLAAIIGHADWLEGELAGDRRLEQIVEIQRAAERGVDMTQQLLSFGRREALKTEALDLTEHVRGMLPMLRRLIGSQIEIIDATMPDLPPIRGNRTQVEQVILNLAVNARDAMGEGGRLTFRTAATALEGDSRAAGTHSDHVMLDVTDTGTGMDADTKRRAFEPFFTTKEVGKGTGLGLATVYGIVQDMHGLIDIDSTPGRGTTFRIYFPRAADVARPAPAPVEGGPSAETILLIEDDASLRGYLGHVLEEQGYRVLAASSPLEALTVVERHPDPIRVVVSDVAMAGMSGPALVAELTRRHPDLAAVFISGHGEIESSRYGVAPTSRWLQKPFAASDLVVEIQRALAPPQSSR